MKSKTIFKQTKKEIEKEKQVETKIEFEGQDLIVTRIYNAAIADVFDAWIEISKIKKWWGCAECVDVQSEVECKVGGKYNHHMTLETEHGKHEVPGFATLLEYDPPYRLTYTSNEKSDPMTVTVSFSELENGTLVRLVHANIPDMKVEGDIELRQIIREGWTAASEKLSELFDKS